MDIKNNKLVAAGILCGICLVGFFVYSSYALLAVHNEHPTANPSTESVCQQSNSATTTPNWLSPGVGTTTLSCLAQGAKSLTVYGQVVGSSTASIIDVKVEISDNGIDYYPLNAKINTPTGINGTTTVLSLDAGLWRFQFSSTTPYVKGFTDATTTPTRFSFNALFKANYLRVSVFSPIQTIADTTIKTGAAFWGQVLLENEEQSR